jgi:copper transport protein
MAGFAAAGVAWAHPSLIRSEPAANSTLDASPGQVAVWLDEAIEPAYAHLSVYDTRGQRVDRLDAQYLPGFPGDAAATIVVSLPPLPQGSYVVVWRVVSVGDGHPVGGAFAFGVGVPPDTGAAASAAAEASFRPDLSTHLIRFMGLLGQLVLLGVVVFRGLVWTPGLRAAAANSTLDGPALEAEARRTLTVAADILVGALVIGVLGALYVQARAVGVVFWELFGTRWGMIWIARAGLALVVAALMESLLEGRRPAWLSGGLAFGLVLTTTLTSHSSAQPGWLGPAVDLAHQIGAAVWLGGLLMLVIALVSAPKATADPQTTQRLRAEWVARYAGVAAASVGVLLASGLALAAEQVGNWAGLALTRYGQSLLVKLGLVGVALAFAAYNSLRRARSAGWVAMEAAVVLGAVLLAGRLADLPPSISTTPADEATASESLAFETQAGSLGVIGRVSPARSGANVFSLTVTGPDGLAVEGAEVRLTFMAVGSALTAEAEAVETGVGVYMVSSPALGRQGAWQVRVSVARPNAALPDIAAVDLEVGLDGVVRLAGEPPPRAVRVTGWLNRFGAAVLAGAALAVAVGWSWFAGRAAPSRLRPAWLVAGLLVAAIVVILVLNST